MDLRARQRLIARSIVVTIPGSLAVIGVSYALLPPLLGLDEPAARLALALRWLVVAMIPYVLVCLTIASRRFREGSHDPTAGGESRRLEIHCRVMQNTLEQLVWLAVCVLALASLLGPNEMQLVPIACTFFAFARLLYWHGYLRSDTLGRAPGVQLTFTLNIGLLVLVVALFARSLFASP
ncbi:MAG: MAPEG family protein [Labilithrix sp.]|nr:MAPEG family protein [Labilithrix sp.]